MHSIQEKRQHSLLFHVTETEFSSDCCMSLGLWRLDGGITQKLNVEKKEKAHKWLVIILLQQNFQ